MGESRTASAVSISEVTKRFDDVTALNDLTLDISKGAIFGLLGPNGSGKTTLIRLLVGLFGPDSGSVSVLGVNPLTLNLHQRLGYMTQQPALYGELTVNENLDFFGRIYGLGRQKRRAKRDELISFVELEEKADSAVRTLSGGMKQRVSLACALIHSPEIIFLDEPTVGIDPALRLSFWQYFHDLAAQGVTIVISSHVMDEAAKCDKFGLLLGGHLLAQGSLATLLAKTGKDNLEDAFLFLTREQS